MSLQFKNVYRVLCLFLAAQAAHAVQGGVEKVKPSDCRPRDADSTCATAVAGAPAPEAPSANLDTTLYDGPLGGVPALGYAYWGWDFFAEEAGIPPLVRQDEFINHSSSPVTIKLSFNIPTGHPCHRDCLPGVQFQVDIGWFKIDPPFDIQGNTVSVSQTFEPGRGYGWVIALWQSTNPRLTVTIPKGSVATLKQVGISPRPATATEIPLVTGTCECWDASIATCSEGSHFSNGLLGPWSQNFDTYARAGAFNTCPPKN